MPRLRSRTSVAVALLSVAAATASGGDRHVNEKVGYRLDLPGSFEPSDSEKQTLRDMLVHLDDFLVDRFYGSERLTQKNGAKFRPTLDVYFFPERTAVEEALKKERHKELYLHFEDYAKKRFKGFYFDDYETIRVGPYEAKLSVMRYEKLTGSVTKRGHVCAIPAPGGELAIVFNGTKDHFKARRSLRLRAFRSFRVLDDEKGLSPIEKPLLDALEAGMKAEREKAAKQRVTVKVPVVPIPARPDPSDLMSLRDSAYEREIAKLKGDWRSHRTDHFLLLYKKNAKGTKKVVRHLDAVREYLEGNFGTFGDIPVQDGLVRFGSFVANGAAMNTPLGHVPSFGISYSDKNSAVVASRFNPDFIRWWISQRNPIAYRTLPSWLSDALVNSFRHSRAKGPRLVLEPAKRKKGSKPKNYEVIPFDRLLGPESEELLKKHKTARGQAASLVDYLHWGRGAKNAATRGLLFKYVERCGSATFEAHQRNVDRAARMKAVLDKDVDSMSPEELLEREDVIYRLKRSAELDLKQAVADIVYADLFSDWTADDWAELEEDWARWLWRR